MQACKTHFVTGQKGFKTTGNKFLKKDNGNKMKLHKMNEQAYRNFINTRNDTYPTQENIKSIPMKAFTQNVKIVLNFFPYLIKKIYFKA
jgi:hypothetical protein